MRERSRPTFNGTDLPRLSIIKFNRLPNGKREIYASKKTNRRRIEERLTEDQAEQYFDNMPPGQSPAHFDDLPDLSVFRFYWTPSGEKQIGVDDRRNGAKLVERVAQNDLTEYFENM